MPRRVSLGRRRTPALFDSVVRHSLVARRRENFNVRGYHQPAWSNTAAPLAVLSKRLSKFGRWNRLGVFGISRLRRTLHGESFPRELEPSNLNQRFYFS